MESPDVNKSSDEIIKELFSSLSSTLQYPENPQTKREALKQSSEDLISNFPQSSCSTDPQCDIKYKTNTISFVTLNNTKSVKQHKDMSDINVVTPTVTESEITIIDETITDKNKHLRPAVANAALLQKLLVADSTILSSRREKQEKTLSPVTKKRKHSPSTKMKSKRHKKSHSKSPKTVKKSDSRSSSSSRRHSRSRSKDRTRSDRNYKSTSSKEMRHRSRSLSRDRVSGSYMSNRRRKTKSRSRERNLHSRSQSRERCLHSRSQSRERRAGRSQSNSRCRRLHSRSHSKERSIISLTSDRKLKSSLKSRKPSDHAHESVSRDPLDVWKSKMKAISEQPLKLDVKEHFSEPDNEEIQCTFDKNCVIPVSEQCNTAATTHAVTLSTDLRNAIAVLDSVSNSATAVPVTKSFVMQCAGQLKPQTHMDMPVAKFDIPLPPTPTAKQNSESIIKADPEPELISMYPPIKSKKVSKKTLNTVDTLNSAISMVNITNLSSSSLTSDIAMEPLVPSCSDNGNNIADFPITNGKYSELPITADTATFSDTETHSYKIPQVRPNNSQSVSSSDNTLKENTERLLVCGNVTIQESTVADSSQYCDERYPSNITDNDVRVCGINSNTTAVNMSTHVMADASSAYNANLYQSNFDSTCMGADNYSSNYNATNSSHTLTDAYLGNSTSNYPENSNPYISRTNRSFSGTTGVTNDFSQSAVSYTESSHSLYATNACSSNPAANNQGYGNPTNTDLSSTIYHNNIANSNSNTINPYSYPGSSLNPYVSSNPYTAAKSYTANDLYASASNPYTSTNPYDTANSYCPSNPYSTTTVNNQNATSNSNTNEISATTIATVDITSASAITTSFTNTTTTAITTNTTTTATTTFNGDYTNLHPPLPPPPLPPPLTMPCTAGYTTPASSCHTAGPVSRTPSSEDGSRQQRAGERDAAVPGPAGAGDRNKGKAVGSIRIASLKDSALFSAAAEIAKRNKEREEAERERLKEVKRKREKKEEDNNCTDPEKSKQKDTEKTGKLRDKRKENDSRIIPTKLSEKSDDQADKMEEKSNFESDARSGDIEETYEDQKGNNENNDCLGRVKALSKEEKDKSNNDKKASTGRRSRSKSKERHRSYSKDRHRSKSKGRHRSKSREQHRSKSREKNRSVSPKQKHSSRSHNRSRSRERSSKHGHKKSLRSHRSKSKDRRSTSVEKRHSKSDDKKRDSSKDRRDSKKGRNSKDRSSDRRRRRSRSTERRRRSSRSHSRQKSSRSSHRKKKGADIEEDCVKALKDKVTRKRLLEIARQNAIVMVANGQMPPTVGPHGLVGAGGPTPVPTQGKSVDDLTAFCKQLAQSGEYSDEEEGDNVLVSSERESSDDETSRKKSAFSYSSKHPFEIKDKPITMNIRNAPMLPTKTNAERMAETSKLREQFPVSSGSHHREKDKEWVPVEQPRKQLAIMPGPSSCDDDVSGGDDGPCDDTSIEIDRVFPEVDESLRNLDLTEIVSERLSAMRKLQENPDDPEAKEKLNTVQKTMSEWAKSKQEPGRFMGSTGVKVLSQSELSGGHQAWARKEQLKTAAPVSSHFGLRMLQKMGWNPGEGLGKNKEGSTEPLMLEVKTDKKGLHAPEEATAQKAPIPLAKSLSGEGLLGDGEQATAASLLQQLHGLVSYPTVGGAGFGGRAGGGGGGGLLGLGGTLSSLCGGGPLNTNTGSPSGGSSVDGSGRIAGMSSGSAATSSGLPQGAIPGLVNFLQSLNVNTSSTRDGSVTTSSVLTPTHLAQLRALAQMNLLNSSTQQLGSLGALGLSSVLLGGRGAGGGGGGGSSLLGTPGPVLAATGGRGGAVGRATPTVTDTNRIPSLMSLNLHNPLTSQMPSARPASKNIYQRETNSCSGGGRRAVPQGKHPVSALVEYCIKHKWNPPQFDVIYDSGPDHKKNYLMKVRVNGQDYRPSQSSLTKKLAKATAAAACLVALGVIAPHRPNVVDAVIHAKPSINIVSPLNPAMNSLDLLVPTVPTMNSSVGHAGSLQEHVAAIAARGGTASTGQAPMLMALSAPAVELLTPQGPADQKGGKHTTKSRGDSANFEPLGSSKLLSAVQQQCGYLDQQQQQSMNYKQCINQQDKECSNLQEPQQYMNMNQLQCMNMNQEQYFNMSQQLLMQQQQQLMNMNQQPFLNMSQLQFMNNQRLMNMNQQQLMNINQNQLMNANQQQCVNLNQPQLDDSNTSLLQLQQSLARDSRSGTPVECSDSTPSSFSTNNVNKEGRLTASCRHSIPSLFDVHEFAVAFPPPCQHLDPFPPPGVKLDSFPPPTSALFAPPPPPPEDGTPLVLYSALKSTSDCADEAEDISYKYMSNVPTTCTSVSVGCSPLVISSLPLSGSTAPLLGSTVPLQSINAPIPTSSAPLQTSTAPLPTTTAPLTTSTAPLPTSTAPPPTSTASLPTSSAPLPTSNAPLLTSSAPLPTSTATLPTSSAQLPTSSASLQLICAPLQSISAPLPTSNAQWPASCAPLPSVSAPLLTTSSPLPTINASLPTINAPLPTINAPLPTINAPLPTISAPLPTISGPLPTISTPLTSINTALSTNSTPLPTNSAPLSTNCAPLLTNSAPLPTNGASLPTNGAPLPTNSAPLKTNNGSLPSNSALLATVNIPLPTSSNRVHTSFPCSPVSTTASAPSSATTHLSLVHNSFHRQLPTSSDDFPGRLGNSASRTPDVSELSTPRRPNPSLTESEPPLKKAKLGGS